MWSMFNLLNKPSTAPPIPCETHPAQRPSISSEPLEARGYKHTSESFKKVLRFEMSDSSGPHRFELESKVEKITNQRVI